VLSSISSSLRSENEDFIFLVSPFKPLMTVSGLVLIDDSASFNAPLICSIASFSVETVLVVSHLSLPTSSSYLFVSSVYFLNLLAAGGCLPSFFVYGFPSLVTLGVISSLPNETVRCDFSGSSYYSSFLGFLLGGATAFNYNISLAPKETICSCALARLLSLMFAGLKEGNSLTVGPE
jgi:hypothetical protein